MERKLIYADELEKKLLNMGLSPALVRGMLENMKSVDAVEVVRCKECIHHEAKHIPIPGSAFDQVYTFYFCQHWDHEQGMSPNEVEADDFCSYGERRTDNE